MAFRPEPKSEFGRLAKYIKFLTQFPRATSIRPGNFYVYVYKFDKDNDFKVIKYWDLMPLIFAYEEYQSKDKNKMLRAINLHHSPVRPRQLWLAKAKKLMETKFETDSELTRIENWKPLFMMMKKIAKKTVRQYRKKRMVQVRRIPNDRVEEVIKYYARTYYGISIGRVEKDYLVFRWNK